MVSITTEMEPSFLGIGPHHLAVGMNNRIWYYKIDKSDSTKLSISSLGDREYLGSVKNVCLNSEFVSVLFEGRLQIHTVSILYKTIFLLYFYLEKENVFSKMNDIRIHVDPTLSNIP